FWTESEEARAIRHDVPSHPLLGHRLRVAEPVWQVEIGRRLQPFLADHGVDGAVVFPAAAYLEMLLAAARELCGDGPWGAERIGAVRLYRDLASEGHQFGPTFRGIELLWRADGMALGRIATPAALAGGTAGHLMHPAILDSCLQVIRGFRGFPEREEVGV